MAEGFRLKKIDVFILCGGKGKRLRPVCCGSPKPMVRIAGVPFLDILIDYLSSLGLRRFILGAGYKAKYIKEYIKKEKSGLNIILSCESRPLGTGGAVKKAANLIRSKQFFVINGDSLSRFEPKKFLNFHKRKKGLASILLRKVSDCADYGQIVMDGLERIRGFNEKKMAFGKTLVNAGVYIFDKRIFAFMPKSKNFSLERDFFPKLALGNRVFGYRQNGSFIDIGTPKRLLAAQRFINKNKKWISCKW